MFARIVRSAVANRYATAGRAALGGLTSALLFSVPGGPLLGGALAGYLEGGGDARSAKLGAAVGLLAAALVAGGYLLVGRFLLAGIDPRLVGRFVDTVGLFALLAALYVGGLSLAGGVVGGRLAARES